MSQQLDLLFNSVVKRPKLHFLILAALTLVFVPTPGSSLVSASPRALLCDRTIREGTIERRHFDKNCPRGWRTASSGHVLCSRGAGLERKTFEQQCPSGWIFIVIDQGLNCIITKRSYACSFPPGVTRPSTTVIPTTSTTRATTTTTTTVIPTTSTTRATTTTTTTTTTTPSVNFDAIAYELEVLRLTNVERVANGLLRLESCPSLQTAARGHSRRMNDGQFFSHDDPGTGKSSTDRIRDAGYLSGASSWSVGENIAYGYASAAENVTGWMNSPGHRANILKPEFTHLGVGVILGRKDEWQNVYSNWTFVPYSTQNFGRGGSC